MLSCLPQLRSYARSLTRRVDVADDLVQDCVHKAFEKMHMWQPGSNMRAWLFTIMHNIHADQVRRQVNGPQFVSSEDHKHAAMQQKSSLNPELASTLDELDHALSLLSPGHREVIHLVCMEEMRYAEVAEVLDVPVGTVMSRLSRAREQLRSIMYDNKHPNLRRVK